MVNHNDDANVRLTVTPRDASGQLPSAAVRIFRSPWTGRFLLLLMLLVPELLLRAGAFKQIYPVFWLEQAYPQLVRFWSLLTVPLDFSLTLWVIAPALVVGACAALWSARRGGWRIAIYRLALLLCVLNAWHTLNWGLNYARAPLHTTLALSGVPDEDSQLALFEYLVGVLRDTVGSPSDVPRALESGAAALNELAGPLGLAENVPHQLRTTPAGLLLRGGVSGFISPLTLEPHIDAALAPYLQVSIGLHELAHVAGVANEGDATLLAAVAGLRAADPFARYAVALQYVYQIPVPPDRRAELLTLVPGRAERAAQSAARLSRELRSGWYAQLQSRVLDLYLKWQGAADGLADYDNGARVLALAYRQSWF